MMPIFNQDESMNIFFISLFIFFSPVHNIKANDVDTCSSSFWQEAGPLDVEHFQTEDLTEGFCGQKQNTPLHQAALYSSDPFIIKLLVHKGSDVEAVNNLGESVLMHSALNENPEIYQTVLEIQTQIQEFRSALLDAAIQEHFHQMISEFNEDNTALTPKQSDNNNHPTTTNNDRGGYFSVIVGGLWSGAAQHNFSDTDKPTSCEQFWPVIIGFYDEVSSLGCDYGRGQWSNIFRSGHGLLGGYSIGYAWKNLRLEQEYLRRHQTGSNHSIINSDNFSEFIVLNESVSDIHSDAIFGNIFYDFPTERIRPHIGFGIGGMQYSFKYNALFLKNPDPSVIFFIHEDNPFTAGTTIASNNETFRSLGLATQVLAGFNIPVSESFSLDIQARYYRLLSEFKSGSEWDVFIDQFHTGATYMQSVEGIDGVDLTVSFKFGQP